MRCDAHAVALALALGLCCSLCLVPLREVLQVKLKLLACAKAVAALVVGQHLMPRRFPRAWVARCPNCKEQGCRDRPASRPLHRCTTSTAVCRHGQPHQMPEGWVGSREGSGSRQCTTWLLLRSCDPGQRISTIRRSGEAARSSRFGWIRCCNVSSFSDLIPQSSWPRRASGLLF
jgi:hypothetical protein